MMYSMANERERKRTATEAGTELRRTFKWRMNNETGKKELIEDEIINRQEEIDSYKDECDIQNIIKRASFDPTLWEKYNYDLGSGEITDITGMPGNLAEAQQLMIDVEQNWDKLPREIKSKFNNDFDLFIHTFGTIEWASAMGLTKEREELKKAESEVKGE